MFGSQLFLPIIPWRFALSKISVYEFLQQNSLLHLKNRFKGHFSITQIPGNRSVYLGEEPNTIILPLVKILALLLNTIQMRFFQPGLANQHQFTCPENKTNHWDCTKIIHYFNIQHQKKNYSWMRERKVCILLEWRACVDLFRLRHPFSKTLSKTKLKASFENTDF